MSILFLRMKRVLGRHMEPAEGEDHLVIRDLGGLAMDSPWIHGGFTMKNDRFSIRKLWMFQWIF